MCIKPDRDEYEAYYPISRFGVDLKPKWYHNETVLFRREGIMASITIKNIPEELYEKLKNE